MDHHRAVVYIAHGREMTEHVALETPDTQFEYSDREGGPGVSGSEPHNKEHYASVFLNFFADAMAKMDQAEGIRRYHIFMPVDMKNIVDKKLPQKIMERTIPHVGNVTKSDPMDLLERVNKHG